MQKMRTNFSKHIQEVKKFEEKVCYEEMFGAWLW
jgi:hypothetical protein